MTDIHALHRELVVVNRILSHEEIVHSYGHASVRNPTDPAHFFLAASLDLTVRTSSYLKKNALAQLAAIPLEPIHFLSDAEIDAVNTKMGSPCATKRVWENWATRSEVEYLLDANS